MSSISSQSAQFYLCLKTHSMYVFHFRLQEWHISMTLGLGKIKLYIYLQTFICRPFNNEESYDLDLDSFLRNTTLSPVHTLCPTSFPVCMCVSRGRTLRRWLRKQRIKRKKMTEEASRISKSFRKYKIYTNVNHFKNHFKTPIKLQDEAQNFKY